LISNKLNIFLCFLYLFKNRIHLNFDEDFVNLLMFEREQVAGSIFQSENSNAGHKKKKPALSGRL